MIIVLGIKRRNEMKIFIKIMLILIFSLHLIACKEEVKKEHSIKKARINKKEETMTKEKIPDLDTVWDWNNIEITEGKFRELLTKTDNPELKLEIQTQIARTFSLRGKFQMANEILDSIEKDLKEEMTTAKIRYYLERGRTLNSSGDKEEAKRFFILAWDLGRKTNGLNLAIDAAHMMGIAETPDKQLEWNLKALKLAESSSDKKDRGWLGTLYNNIGWTYFDNNDYDKALEMFKKDLKLRNENPALEPKLIARWSIGRTFRAMGEMDDALSIQKGIEIDRKYGKLDEDGYNFEELAELSEYFGKEEEAKLYFKKAYDLLSKDQWFVKNESERLERMKKKFMKKD